MKIKISVLMLYLGIIVSAIVSAIVVTKLDGGTLQIVLVSFGITFVIDSIFFLIGIIIEAIKEIKDDEEK